MPENTMGVMVLLERYQELITKEYNLSLIGRALLDAATLNYNDKALTFRDEPLNMILKMLYPEAYAQRLKTLQEDKAKAAEVE